MKTIQIAAKFDLKIKFRRNIFRPNNSVAYFQEKKAFYQEFVLKT